MSLGGRMFGWNKKLLEDKLKSLNEDDLDKYGYLYREMISGCNGYVFDTLKNTKEDILDIINILRLPKEEKKIFIKEALASSKDKEDNLVLDSFSLEYNVFYNNLPKDIRNLFDFIQKHTTYFDNRKLKLRKKIITKEDLYAYAFEFFTMINSEYKSKLDFLFDKHLVNISDKRIAKRYDLYNVTLGDEKDKVPYVSIVNSNSDEVYTSFNHELTHALKYLYDKHFINNSLSYLDEVNSIYSSFLTCFLNINSNDFFKAFYNYYYELKNNIIQDYISKKLATSVNHNKSSVFINSWNDFVDIDFKQVLCQKANCDFVYGFSLIIALYLLDVYRKDEEKSFCFFDRSLKYSGNNYKDYFKLIEFPYKDSFYVSDLLLDYDDFFDEEIIKRRIRK